ACARGAGFLQVSQRVTRNQLAGDPQIYGTESNRREVDPCAPRIDSGSNVVALEHVWNNRAAGRCARNRFLSVQRRVIQNVRDVRSELHAGADDARYDEGGHRKIWTGYEFRSGDRLSKERPIRFE